MYKKLVDPKQTIKLQQPPINELPYVNYKFFNVLFQLLSPEDIISIFTLMLLEKSVTLHICYNDIKILIISEEVEKLIPIIDSLQNLIYPFQYTTCIPVLISDN